MPVLELSRIIVIYSRFLVDDVSGYNACDAVLDGSRDLESRTPATSLSVLERATILGQDYTSDKVSSVTVFFRSNT